MSSRTERLQASASYKVFVLVLTVVVGAGVWMVFTGSSWAGALVVAALLIAMRLAIGAWFRDRS